MKCKNCGREIEPNSIYCNWCGEKQIKAKKPRDEIKIPTPKQLRSGAWNVYLRAENQSVTEATKELCIAKAKAIRAGFLQAKKSAPKLTLNDAITTYIVTHDAVLSPSTIRSYEIIRAHRFQEYINKEIADVNWQYAINAEAKLCAPKTLKNAWGLVARIMRVNHIDIPDINLPTVQKEDREWLDYNQIQVFLKTLRGRTCEIAALLALHSLRRSELLAITPARIQQDGIHVHGAIVPNKDGVFVHKDTNKNQSSKRIVPIMIPRLQELIKSTPRKPDEPYVTIAPNHLWDAINATCRSAGVPEVGVHGLRRSFASLAYHLGWSERETMMIGGWSDYKVMHEIYIKLDEASLKSAADKMTKFYNSESST